MVHIPILAEVEKRGYCVRDTLETVNNACDGLGYMMDEFSADATCEIWYWIKICTNVMVEIRRVV